MSRELDELLLENDRLKTDVQRLSQMVESNITTINSMAEGIAMMSYPNWKNIENKKQIIMDIAVAWMKRAEYEAKHERR